MDTFIPNGMIHGPILPQFALDAPITLGAKVMYAILCNYASKNDRCWPSHRKLAENLSCSVSSVKKYLSELVGIRLIAVRREQYRSSVYYMLLPDALKGAGAKQARKPEAERLPETVCHEAEIDRRQPETAYTPPKIGYLNTLNKYEENTNPPLPPVPVSRSIPPAPRPMGGVGASFSDFETLWEAYPRKDAKALAEQIHKQLLRTKQLPPLPDLLAAIARFSATAQWRKENGRFIPYLSNFLTSRRWLDPLSPEEEAANHKRLEAERIALARKRTQEAEDARKAEEKARLRPIFDAFTERFSAEARQANEQQDNMRFGTWRHSYGKYAGPTAADVPDGNTLSILDFIASYQRRRGEADYRAARLSSEAALDFYPDSKTNSVVRPQYGSFPARSFPAPRPLCAAV